VIDLLFATPTSTFIIGFTIGAVITWCLALILFDGNEDCPWW